MTTSRPTDAPPRTAGAEPLAGYPLVERLGSGGYGEVWRCSAPGGLPKAVKFVRGPEADPDPVDSAVAQELGALERVKVLRHPYLLGLDRVEVLGTELVLVMELADGTLLDRQRACAAAGLAGIPRGELLPLLAEAAEALDLLAAHGLQHLDVKPANLFLVGGHLKVGDFGLVGTVGGVRARAADSLVGITPKYVAPEVLRGAVAAASDQYALALVAYELLTGRFPFPVRSARKLVVMHSSAAPDLSAADPPAAAVLGRALAKDPADRFPSCREFVRRLDRAWPRTDTPPAADTVPAAPAAGDTGVIPCAAVTVPARAEGLPAVRVFDGVGRAAEPAPPGLTAGDLVRAMIRVWLLGAVDVPGDGGGDPADLFCRFPVMAARTELVGWLVGLADRWGAGIEEAAGEAFELTVPPSGGWLRRLISRPEPVRVAVILPPAGPPGRGEVTALARRGAGRADAHRHALAAEVLSALKTVLADGRDDRQSARYPVAVPSVAYPVGPDGRVGPGAEARCVDLSDGGARLESAADLPPAGRLYLRFPGHPTASRYGVLCRVVRRAERGPGHFEFGCRFVDG